MIFVTVGTHEQPFDRLLREIDELIEEGIIHEDVFAQIGYSKYEPRNYAYKSLIGYEMMDYYVSQARMVITHGGPGSIFHPIQYGKTPIVVPRSPDFHEHVDDHQILFTKRLEEANKVIGVYDIANLKNAILNYDTLAEKCRNHSSSKTEFISKFNALVSNKLHLRE